MGTFYLFIYFYYLYQWKGIYSRALNVFVVFHSLIILGGNSVQKIILKHNQSYIQDAHSSIIMSKFKNV